MSDIIKICKKHGPLIKKEVYIYLVAGVYKEIRCCYCLENNRKRSILKNKGKSKKENDECL